MGSTGIAIQRFCGDLSERLPYVSYVSPGLKTSMSPLLTARTGILLSFAVPNDF